MKRRLLSLIAALCLAGCDGDPYSGFGAICPEEHPAVAHLRSLTHDQLASLYTEILRLRNVNPNMYGVSGEAIPENLQFLNAIRIYANMREPVILFCAGMDEKVLLHFTEPESQSPQIVLSWAAGTNEDPYRIESQVLWELDR